MAEAPGNWTNPADRLEVRVSKASLRNALPLWVVRSDPGRAAMSPQVRSAIGVALLLLIFGVVTFRALLT
jgi:hypothetical protein